MTIYCLLSRHRKIKAYHSTLIFFSLFPSQFSSLFPLISPSLILFFFNFLLLCPHFWASIVPILHLLSLSPFISIFFLPPVPSYLQLPFTFSFLTLNLSIANPFCLPLFFYQSSPPPFLHILCTALLSARHTAAPVLSVILAFNYEGGGSQNGSSVAMNYIRALGVFCFYVYIFFANVQEDLFAKRILWQRATGQRKAIF